MNGRMLSRAIQSSEPDDDRGHDQDGDPRRERHEPRLCPGRPSGSTNGGGGQRGRPASQRRRAGPSAVGGAGSSIVPQTTRRGRPLETAPGPAGRGAGRAEPATAAPALAAASSPARRGARAGGAASWSTPGRPRSRPPGLPLFRARRAGPARIAFGAPLPAGMALERELADIVLTELCPDVAGP